MLYIFVSGRGHQNREEKTKRWHEGVAARVRSSESEFKNFFYFSAEFPERTGFQGCHQGSQEVEGGRARRYAF